MLDQHKDSRHVGVRYSFWNKYDSKIDHGIFQLYLEKKKINAHWHICTCWTWPSLTIWLQVAGLWRHLTVAVGICQVLNLTSTWLSDNDNYCGLLNLTFFVFQSIGPWADAFYKSICPYLCVSVCVSVCVCVCSLLRYGLNIFLPQLPEVGCPNLLDIRNPWWKVLETSGLRFENFCS